MKQLKQKIFYDKKTDVLWLLVKKGVEENHQEVAPGVSIELGKKGELLGVEILNASQVLGSKLGFKLDTVANAKSVQSAVLHKIR